MAHVLKDFLHAEVPLLGPVCASPAKSHGSFFKKNKNRLWVIFHGASSTEKNSLHIWVFSMFSVTEMAFSSLKVRRIFLTLRFSKTLEATLCISDKTRKRL